MKPEDPKQPAANLGRRGFLLSASLGGAGAVAASLAAKTPATAVPAPAAEPEAGGGYRVSDHVLHYYRTTRT